MRRRELRMEQHAQTQAPTTNKASAPVLVIDGEESVIDLITLGFRYEDFELVAAGDGEEGIERIDRTLSVMLLYKSHFLVPTIRVTTAAMPYRSS
jgi:CheY-like chemotaxis protein